MRSKWFKVFVVAIIVFTSSKNQAFATKNEIYVFRPGMHVSRDHQLKNAQLETLLQGFRTWSGLKGIEVDKDGNVVVRDRDLIDGGSSIARQLLLSAIDSEDSFTISAFENSATIAFAQIESTDTYLDGQGRRFTRWEIRLDFADFKQLNGSSDVKRTFDPAINVAHEIAHAIHRFDDVIQGEDRIGECERYINKMREELGLPQRAAYFPHYGVASRRDGSTFVQGEFQFLDSLGKEVYMTFDVDRVFDRSKARSRGEVLASLLSRRQGKQK
jgi:hypothetical protein